MRGEECLTRRLRAGLASVDRDSRNSFSSTRNNSVWYGLHIRYHDSGTDVKKTYTR